MSVTEYKQRHPLAWALIAGAATAPAIMIQAASALPIALSSAAPFEHPACQCLHRRKACHFTGLGIICSAS